MAGPSPSQDTAPAQQAAPAAQTTATGCSTTHTTPFHDPLVALERELLAHHRHHFHHFRHHDHAAAAEHAPQTPEAPPQTTDGHLAPPSLTTDGRSPSHSPSRSPSRSPSPGARRCMAATAAWTPRLDRRQSWDGQLYRRTMMTQAAGLVCRCHPGTPGQACAAGLDHGLEHRQTQAQWDRRKAYEADRGFSEVASGAP